MTLEAVLDHFEKVQKNGAGWKSRCPSHQDSNPSLSISENDGKILLHCHAGCEPEKICAAAGIGLRDLFIDEKPTPRIVSEYDYTDEAGKLLFQVVRFSPKDFRQRRRDEKGEWIWNLGNTRRVLFSLPGVLTAENVVVTEGEKDAETGWRLGFPTTCNSGGAGKWKDEYSDVLRGKNVVIIPDNDEPGRKHGEQVATSLHLRAASVKLLELSGAKDLTEWAEQGGTREALEVLIAEAAAWKPETEKESARLESFSTAQLFTATEKEIEWLCWPFAAVGLNSIVDALPKLGKTRFYLEGIKASRDRRPFLSYPTKPMRVVYVSEQSAASLAMQAREVGFTGDEPAEELRWITREQWPRFTFMEFLQRLEADILKEANYNTLIIDTWHTVARLEDENAASEVNASGNATLDVAARNRLATSISRHDRKSGGDVGVSGRSSIQLSGLVDVILHLTRISNQPSQRKLQTISRVPGLPAEVVIDLVNGAYVNLGEPTAPAEDRAELVAEWYAANTNLIASQVVEMFAAMTPSVVMTERNARRLLAKAKERK